MCWGTGGAPLFNGRIILLPNQPTDVDDRSDQNLQWPYIVACCRDIMMPLLGPGQTLAGDDMLGALMSG
jgi:hypothetical protein